MPIMRKLKIVKNKFETFAFNIDAQCAPSCLICLDIKQIDTNFDGKNTLDNDFGHIEADNLADQF